MTSLAGMAAHARKRVERLKREEPLHELFSRPLYARRPLALGGALKPGAPIAEIRFADPERGFLVPRERATPEEAAALALRAAAAGAAAVAVWTERNFHAGDYSHLEAARAACPGLPLVARDLLVDPWQIDRCRAAGADAVEVMPDLMGPLVLGVMIPAIRGRGLEPVVVSSVSDSLTLTSVEP